MGDLYVDWQKNPVDGSWHRLRGLEVGNIVGHGVYLIWHSGIKPRVIYVGHGQIANRLLEHQRARSILSYEAEGTLLTSWGIVDTAFSIGVERYLIETYDPIENYRKPVVRPISVNLLVR